MTLHVGLDVGATSLKLVALSPARLSPEPLQPETSANFQKSALPPANGHDEVFLVSRYRRIQGNPLAAAHDLLADLEHLTGPNAIASLRVTGSGGRRIAALLGCGYENEFRALAKGVRRAYPEVRTIFEMGGASSRYLRLDPTDASGYLGIVDYQSSGDCAAGTGSFMDQQASRLRYSVEEAAVAACAEDRAARVAGRCSVFAKTDMIHAQQRGYSTGQILRGLCEAIARNFKSSIVRGRPVVPPVLFAGGVAMNEAVERALAQVFRLKTGELLRAELPYCLSALGAALFAAEEKQATRVFIHMLNLHEPAVTESAASEPLSLENVRLLGREATKAKLSFEPGTIEAYLGIDIGSVSTNLVVLDAAGTLLKEIYLPTAGRPIEVVNDGLREIHEDLGEHLNIRGVGTTGSGRELIGELVGADTVNDEITAHKTGAVHVCRAMGTDLVDTIFEIGGQDSKFIRLDRGIVVDFTMNEACAAGTGSFLEEQAEKLGISIKGEFAQLALEASCASRRTLHCVYGSRPYGRSAGRRTSRRSLCRACLLRRDELPESRGARPQNRQCHLLPGWNRLQRCGRGGFREDPAEADHRAASQWRDWRDRHGAARARTHAGHRSTQPFPRIRLEPGRLHQPRFRLSSVLERLRNEGIRHRGAKELLG